MPNIKSAKKRVLVIEKKTLENRMVKSAIKTELKKFEAAVEAADKDNAKVLFNDATKKLDKSVLQGILHKNNANNRKAKLAIKLNSLN